MATSPLAQALGDLEEEKAVTLVSEKLATGEAALSILEELQAGMNIVGERFEEGEYYLSELIYSADIFKKAGAPLTGRAQGTRSRTRSAPWSWARSRTTSTTSARTSWPRS
jgi:methanogenic corrinoid protein MtbC1